MQIARNPIPVKQSTRRRAQGKINPSLTYAQESSQTRYQVPSSKYLLRTTFWPTLCPTLVWSWFRWNGIHTHTVHGARTKIIVQTKGCEDNDPISIIKDRKEKKTSRSVNGWIRSRRCWANCPRVRCPMAWSPEFDRTRIPPETPARPRHPDS